MQPLVLTFGCFRYSAYLYLKKTGNMTQKEKLMLAFLAIQSCKNSARNIITECSKYSSTACSYAKDIIETCDEYLKKK